MSRSSAVTTSTTNGSMPIFTLIWFGQLISLIGSGLTEFALGVWVYQRTGAATDFALIVFLVTLPYVVVSPIAGPLVDRWDRRKVMILADSGAALSTLTVAALAWTGGLEIWHVYVAVLVTSTCAAFQFPAYSTLVTVLVPKAQLGRANGMVEMAWAAGQVVSPMLAGLLLDVISLYGLILVDVVSFLLGVSVLALVRLPQQTPAATEEPSESKGSFLKEAAYGWTYIVERPGLRALLTFFVVVNFAVGLFNALFVPMVLSFASSGTLGMILSIGGAGILIGSLVMTVWGGPKRRIYGIVGVGPVFGLCVMLMGLQPSVALIAFAGFFYMAAQPFINGCDHAIWQSKVALDVQGRVFSARRAIELSSALLAYLIAGPIADRLVNPLLLEGGALASSIGQIVGAGPGRGIGLIFVLMGGLIVAAAVWGYVSPRVRFIEDELPDAVTEEPAPEPTPVLAAA